MNEITVSRDRIQRHVQSIQVIGCLGADPGDGYLRAAWSDEESEAFEYVSSVGAAAGLHTRYDQVGNLYLRLEGRADEVVQVGSHLDTVPAGGTYDGAAGIIAGLEALSSLAQGGIRPRTALELVVWRGEESATYGVACCGSRAAFGLLDPEVLNREFQNQSLRAAIEGQGYSVAPVESGVGTLSARERDRIKAHLELHIEQARFLESEGLSIGIVTGIRGPLRRRIIVRGRSDHSGATPMGVEYRKDANLALAYMQVELDKLCSRKLAAGHDLVQTVGVVNCDRDFNRKYSEVFSNAYTKISPFGYFTLDIRSDSKEFRNGYVRAVDALIETIARRFGVEVVCEEITAVDPSGPLCPEIQRIVESSCRSRGIAFAHMPSGAFHDVAVVCSQQKSSGESISGGLIFIPCREGISHNPDEYTSVEAIHTGSQVLADSLVALSE